MKTHAAQLLCERTPVVERALGAMDRLLRERFDTALELTDQPGAVALDIDAGLGADTHDIARGGATTTLDIARGGATTTLRGGDVRGLVHGIGAYLRGLRRGDGGVAYAGPDVTHTPDCPVRGVYLASHIYNFYEAAPAEDVTRYVEELALQGFSAICVTVGLFQLDSFDSEPGRRILGQTTRLLQAARDIGMDAALVHAPNNGFRSAPEDLLATPWPDDLGRRGYHGVQICPSNPAGRRYLIETWEEYLDAYRDVGLDYMITWPYDEGGCGCSECWPWGARGFLDVSRMVFDMARSRYPGLRTILSTWMYDTPPAGEWEALRDALAEDASWVDYVMADAHEDFPRFPLDDGVPGGLPLLSFPEISMWGQGPWGGYGTNPLPRRFERLYGQVTGALDGGFLYSEGIFEDVNKALYAGWFNRSDRSVEDTLREYAAWEFDPAVADEFVDVALAFERQHKRDEIGPNAADVRSTVERMDGSLPASARRRWRWRLVMLRAIIDDELLRTGGELRGAALKTCFDELRDIYHAENATPAVNPPVADA